LAPEGATRDRRTHCSHALLLITDHSIVDYDLVLKNAPLIVDTRGIYRVAVPHVVKA
jgi:UDP-N-acetyl-D-glucosamine dehydrogenase